MVHTLIDNKHLNLVSHNISSYNIQDAKIPNKMLIEFGCSPHGIKNAIDLNIFLKCFPKLTMKKGYVLDYVYDYHISHGDILVYARPTDSFPLLTAKQFYDTFPYCDIGNKNLLWTNTFVNQMIIDDSPEGLFDLALFICMLQTVYLYDHGCYCFKNFLYTNDIINKLRQSNRDPMGVEYHGELEKLDNFNTHPYFEHDKEKNRICFLSESAWNGISLETITFINNKPTSRSSRTLIEHNCQILF